MAESNTFDPRRLIFLHGLMSSSQSVKAGLLRSLFPQMLVPDFRGSLEERMALLEEILGQQAGWTLVGSSFGGLMAALFACRHPAQVRRQVLLAPALIVPDFAGRPPAPVDVPTVVYHGTQDDIVPLNETRALAEQVFLNLTFHVVEDDHGLFQTVQTIDWPALLAGKAV